MNINVCDYVSSVCKTTDGVAVLKTLGEMYSGVGTFVKGLRDSADKALKGFDFQAYMPTEFPGCGAGSTCETFLNGETVKSAGDFLSKNLTGCFGYLDVTPGRLIAAVAIGAVACAVLKPVKKQQLRMQSI